MGSLEFAPPYPCCGNLTYHSGGQRCEEYKAGALPRSSGAVVDGNNRFAKDLALSAFRFAWRTEPTHKDTAAGWLPQFEQGHGFRAVRTTYGLTLREVADGWGVSHVELGELERGHRHFIAPADLLAALSQLWLWAVEKNPGIAR